ncbi:hypothetical protein [Leptolyngbya sp. FACHB-261]|uniref:hypothetical protein n=1 Tax=Leptolyngbya sp. FACHB-261 TaxID=2692806 RepID=UPI00168775C8|nr:hypothetical protein [Leptolyngbya sp. FACHB-261]MBD2103759.1 hypothetical protein [Leptolyngbya sp. FACHB-261]
MIKPRIQRRLPECALCLFNTGNPFLFCSVHPQGLTENTCLDFRPDPGLPVEPGSGKFEEEQDEGELMGCEDHWAQVQKLERLNSHPMFTGQCPDCGYEFSPVMHPDVYWDCLECGWADQTE